jgi:hypothetical protein
VGASLRRSPLGRWRGLDGFGRRLSTLFLLQRRQRDRRNARCRLYGHVWRGLRSGGTLGGTGRRLCGLFRLENGLRRRFRPRTPSGAWPPNQAHRPAAPFQAPLGRLPRLAPGGRLI